MGRGCKACASWEPETIDRLLVLGHGPAFVAARWNVKRHHIKSHRDVCLVGERLRAAQE
jgi:hypothetical protein